MGTTTTHLAGIAIVINGRIIQRCIICGLKMVDYDRAREVVFDQEGASRYVKVGELPTDFDASELPDDFCLALVEE